jgi:hypothetical protein
MESSDRIVATSTNMRGQLDDDYTLFESGKVLHEYDRHTYPGGQNLKAEMLAKDLSDEVKQRLFSATPAEDKELAKQLLGMI